MVGAFQTCQLGHQRVNKNWPVIAERLLESTVELLKKSTGFRRTNLSDIKAG